MRVIKNYNLFDNRNRLYVNVNENELEIRVTAPYALMEHTKQLNNAYKKLGLKKVIYLGIKVDDIAWSYVYNKVIDSKYGVIPEKRLSKQLASVTDDPVYLELSYRYWMRFICKSPEDAEELYYRLDMYMDDLYRASTRTEIAGGGDYYKSAAAIGISGAYGVFGTIM